MKKSKFKIFDNLKVNAVNFGNYVFEQSQSVNFIRNVKTTFRTRALVVFLNMLIAVLVARFLGPEGRGEYSAALTFGMIGVYLSLLGLNASNTHFVSKKREFISHFISNNIFFSLFIGILWIFIIIGIQLLFPKLILINTMAVLSLSMLWIPFSLANILSQSLLIGIENIKSFNKVELTAPAVGLLGICLLFIFDIINVESFFFCSLLGQIFGFVSALYYLKPFTQKLLGNLSFKLLKENLLYGLKVLYFPSIFFLLLSSADLLIVKYYLGEKGAGYYSIATALSSLLLLLPGTIGTLFFAKLSAIPDEQMKIIYTTKIVKWLAVLMLIVLSIFFLLAEFIILLIFGQTYEPSIILFTGLIPAIFFASISIIYLNYFSAEGMWIINTFSTAMAVTMNIILNFKMIPFLGIMGAPYAASLSQGVLLMILILYNILRRRSHMTNVFHERSISYD